VSRGQAIAYGFLWASLAVLLSTLVSFVTFRLRKSVAHARRLGQYTLGAKLGEGGRGIVYRPEPEVPRRPPTRHHLPPGRSPGGEPLPARRQRRAGRHARRWRGPRDRAADEPAQRLHVRLRPHARRPLLLRHGVPRRRGPGDARARRGADGARARGSRPPAG